MKKSILLALAGAAFASSAHGFEVVGGSVAIGYSAFTEETDVNKLNFGGQLEFGLSREFSLQGDVNLSKFGLTDIDNRSIGLHGIYHLSSETSLGAFIGTDRVEGANVDFYGIEAGHQFGQFGLEGYLSRADLEGVADGTVIGLKGEYAITPAALVGVRFDNINVDGYDASRLSLTGQYAFTEGFAVTGELGNADIDTYGSETFFGLGVKVSFGAKRGATFDQRSVVDLLPGL
ncbi:porin [Pseudogemmobacter sonorensis]|uniref:porin n=1 Tax=Pseudogemmobacter sonorensis TaxID=2989681 RepID=UPI003679E2B9